MAQNFYISKTNSIRRPTALKCEVFQWTSIYSQRKMKPSKNPAINGEASFWVGELLLVP
ncbi:MAG: hypothetical protein QT03_C0001G1002 [archaeon GW2011_AR10]|nr:MAG: hypothetical protein QT03_C0001G1002 [archaeon GW2011_AR10]